MASEKSVRRMYDAYQIRRKEVAEELRVEFDRMVDERMSEDAAKLRHEIMAAYNDGVTKAELRKAVRAYGNAHAWDKWWTGPKSGPGRPPKNPAVEVAEVVDPDYTVKSYIDPDDSDYTLTEVTFNRVPKNFNRENSPEKFPVTVLMEYGSWMPHPKVRPNEDFEWIADWYQANRWDIIAIVKGEG